MNRHDIESYRDKAWNLIFFIANMAPVSVQFRFDNEQKVFAAGDNVSGAISIVVAGEAITSDSIEIQHVGKAKVQWTERRNNKNHHYHNNEYYFKVKNNVQQVVSGQQLSVGIHDFPFAFTLPTDVPPSFESKFGWIRYYVKVKLGKSWGMSVRKAELFTVNTKLDLNGMFHLANPGQASGTKMKCCLCCKDGPVSATCSVPKTGYVPTESIMVSCEIDNKGRKTMGLTELKIVAEVKYIAHRKTKTSSKEVGHLALPPVGPGDNKSYHNVPFAVPSLAPSGLIGCRIMTLDYYLCLQISLGTFSSLKLFIPITIGNVPTAMAPGVDAPPTYLEAVGANELQDGFVPRYWTFNHYTNNQP